MFILLVKVNKNPNITKEILEKTQMFLTTTLADKRKTYSFSFRVFDAYYTF